MSSCLGKVGESSSNLRFDDRGRGNGDEEKAPSSKAGSRVGGFRACSGCSSVDSTGDCCNILLGEKSISCAEVPEHERARVSVNLSSTRACLVVDVRVAGCRCRRWTSGDRHEVRRRGRRGQREEAMRSIEVAYTVKEEVGGSRYAGTLGRTAPGFTAMARIISPSQSGRLRAL